MDSLVNGYVANEHNTKIKEWRYVLLAGREGGTSYMEISSPFTQGKLGHLIEEQIHIHKAKHRWL